MRSSYKIKAYALTVCDQIRWKRAHARVAQEIENHILDQRDSFMAEGMDEEAATDKAIASTGDAAAIGTQLDRAHRPKPQWAMLLATLALLLIGLISGSFIYKESGMLHLSIAYRIFYIAIGIAGMLSAYFIDFTLLGKYPRIVYFGVLLFSIAVLFISPQIMGRSFYGQYLVLSYPIVLASVIAAVRNKGYMGIAISEFAFLPLGLMALFVPSISGFLHFAAAGMGLLCVAVWKNWFGIKRLYGFILTCAPASIFIAAFMLFKMNAYRWSRLATALNPSLDPYGAGYWSIMTRSLLGGAKMFGPGDIPSQYYESYALDRYLTEANSLLTALITLAGWATFFVVIGALLFFFIKGFMLCFNQKSGLGFFLSLSVLMTLCLQVISYVAFNLGIQFFSPISLPLISYGNTATLVNLALIGFMLSVFRTGSEVTETTVQDRQSGVAFITWDDGVLTIDFKALPSYFHEQIRWKKAEAPVAEEIESRQ